MRAYKISPSQWSLFLDDGACFRRGAFRYVCNLPDPGGEGARRGTRVHGRTEDYLQGRGAPLNPDVLEDSMAMALAQHLPAPGTPEDLERRGVIIEGMIEFERNGILYNGRKDLEWRRVEGVGDTDRCTIVVTDYKTTSDFKYALTVEQLRVHVQPVIYAAHSFWRHTNIEELDLNWLYVKSCKNPPVRPRDLTVTREHVEREMVRIDAGAQRIIETREAGGALEEGRARLEWANTLPYDTTLTACTKYGKEGCPFKSQCAAHGGGSLASVRTLFRAALNRNRRSTEKPGEPDMTADELRAKLAAQKAAKTIPAPAAEAPAKTDAPAVPKFTPPTGRLLTKPPVSPGHNSVVPAAPPDREEVAKTVDASLENSLDGAPKKASPRARTKAKDGTVTEFATFTPVPLDIPVRNPSGFTLCVNTLVKKQPVGPAPILFSDFVSLVHAAIAEAHQVAHYMMIQYTGRAVFSAALDQYLNEHPLDGDDVLYVDARTSEGADALAVLERRAARVLVGV